MLVEVITVSQYQQVFSFLDAAPKALQGVEWRLDFLEHLDLQQIAAVLSYSHLPMIFTLRTKAQGGRCSLKQNAYRNMIRDLATLQPDYLDCEMWLDHGDLDQIFQIAPTTRLLRSWHDFDDFDAHRWSKQQQHMAHPQIYAYKMVSYRGTAVQALAQFAWLAQHSRNSRLIVHTMNHAFSRVLAPVFGSCCCYVAQGNVPGALTLATAVQCYRIPELNRHTKIYALLGHPIDQSVGHLYHNKVFAQKAKNAVYVKIPLTLEDWQQGWNLLNKLTNFCGFSITSPLKTPVAAVACHAMPGQSINTLTRSEVSAQWYGSQTDGYGALSALRLSNKEPKTILLIGGGGANRAIAHAARMQGHQVWLVQRQPQQFSVWYHQQGIVALDYGSLTTMPQPFAAIVFGLPATVELPLLLLEWLTEAVPPAQTLCLAYGVPNTAWLTWVQQHWPKSEVVCGLTMFNAQAKAQQKFWFDAANHGVLSGKDNH